VCEVCPSISVNDAFRIDPTRSATLRKQFMAEMYTRFRKLKGRINEEVVSNDGFGLKTNAPKFDFERSSAKVSAFMKWIKQTEEIEILGVMPGTDSGVAAQSAWTNIYIDTAYKKGIRQAAAKMRAEGADIDESWIRSGVQRPIHADRVGLIYTRTYNELEGITDAMDQQISRVLAQGIADGLNPAQIASQINNRVDAIGLTRARTLARTEVIAAHNDALLNSYDEAGVEGVDVEAEMLTAFDACPICEELAARGPFALADARGLIPGETHPNCRCSFAPIIKNGSGIVLR
jgi:SPP1 gp7 family putative phage head morphogenesis protein